MITNFFLFLKILSKDLHHRVVTLFNKIDTDGSGTIDKEETLKFW